jgi:hypothetical protein
LRSRCIEKFKAKLAAKSKTMIANIVTMEDLERFKNELLNEIKTLLSNSAPGKKQWLKSPDVREMVGISPGTLQTLRINPTLSLQKWVAPSIIDTLI